MLLKATLFRKQVRLLKINLIVEEFFRSADNVAEAREGAQEFLCTQLPKLYPDLTTEGAVGIQEQSSEILEACEQKVMVEKAPQAVAESRDAESGDEEDEGGETLSEAETARGIRRARVVIRAGGRTKLVLYKIMPDPEDRTRWIMIKRDRENGEFMPIQRHGKKRYVKKKLGERLGSAG